jgi:tetratricopeptide (TPR) repeat protein
MGILARSRGDFEDALFHLSNSLEIAKGFESPGPQVAALNNLALAWGDSGDTERALELAEAALRLCASQGDRHREAALHNNMADLLHNAGRTEAAMSHLKRAVAIFAEIGADAETWQPEIWKLVEW